MYVMVSYDIVDDKTRTKVMNFLKDYGTRVQYSVFECELSEEKFKEMKKGVEALINKKKRQSSLLSNLQSLYKESGYIWVGRNKRR